MNSPDLGKKNSAERSTPALVPSMKRGDDYADKSRSLSTENGFSNVDFQFTVLHRLNMPFFGGGGVGGGLVFFCQSPFRYNTQCPSKNVTFH